MLEVEKEVNNPAPLEIVKIIKYLTIILRHARLLDAKTFFQRPPRSRSALYARGRDVKSYLGSRPWYGVRQLAGVGRGLEELLGPTETVAIASRGSRAGPRGPFPAANLHRCRTVATSTWRPTGQASAALLLL